MIPKLNFSSRDAWSRDARSPFQRWPKRRPLRILVDVESFSSEDPTIERIRGFGGDPTVHFREVFRRDVHFGTADDAVVTLPGGEQWGARSIETKKRHVVKYARKAGVTDVESLLRGIIICDVADLFGIDSLVSASSDLLNIGRRYYPSANTMSPDECLALLGLYLRTQDNFTYWQSGASSIRTDRTSFYGQVARQMLPEVRRWLITCPGPESAWAESTNGLAEAVLQRFERALRARDRIHEQLMLPPDDNNIGEALFFFDVLLLSLLGAFDAVARVVHTVYKLTSSIQRANWSSEHKKTASKVGWLYEVSLADAPLAALMFPHAPARDVVEMIGSLRNTIHAQPLQHVGHLGHDLKVARYGVVLPEPATNKFVMAANRLGGKNGLSQWGLEFIAKNQLTIDPGTFVEQLTPASASALNALVAATKVERLVKGRRPAVKPIPPPTSLVQARFIEWALPLAGVKKQVIGDRKS